MPAPHPAPAEMSPARGTPAPSLAVTLRPAHPAQPQRPHASQKSGHLVIWGDSGQHHNPSNSFHLKLRTKNTEQSVSFTELPAAPGPSRAALHPRGHGPGHGRAGHCQYSGHTGFMRTLKSPVAIQGLWSHTQIILHIPAHSMALPRIKAI